MLRLSFERLLVRAAADDVEFPVGELRREFFPDFDDQIHPFLAAFETTDVEQPLLFLRKVDFAEGEGRRIVDRADVFGQRPLAEQCGEFAAEPVGQHHELVAVVAWAM